MTVVTLRVIVDGVTRMIEPGIPLSRWRSVAPTINPIIDELRTNGPVLVLGEDAAGVTHILLSVPGSNPDDRHTQRT